MNYFIIAGEASGDLHGSNLIKAIKAKDSQAVFNFWGGDLMKKEADGCLVHYKDVTIMGFVEVLLNIGSILKNIRTCKQQILACKPDVVVLIDYPGFNLRIAKFCKQHGIKVVYYIAPKIWAWKESRGKKLEQFVDELLLIFPFEFSYFKKWKVKSTYVGNPLKDAIHQLTPNANFYSNNKLNHTKSIIALLPGSRKQEVSKIMPILKQLPAHFPQYQFIICGAPSLDATFYQPYLNEEIQIVFNQTYDVLQHATGAVVCSGTATLETALFNVPQVCGYVAHPISYRIAKLLVKNIKYISLVNLCLDKSAITELIQNDYTLENVVRELQAVLPSGSRNLELMKDYAQLNEALGKAGASMMAAERVIECAKT